MDAITILDQLFYIRDELNFNDVTDYFSKQGYQMISSDEHYAAYMRPDFDSFKLFFNPVDKTINCTFRTVKKVDLTTLFSYAENQYGFGSVNEEGGSSFILERGKLRLNIYLIAIPRNELNLSYEVIYHVALFESLYDGKVEIIMQPPPPLND